MKLLICYLVMSLPRQRMEILTLKTLWVPFLRLATGSLLLIMLGMIGMKKLLMIMCQTLPGNSRPRFRIIPLPKFSQQFPFSCQISPLLQLDLSLA
jgi:hypothetical protein